MPVADYKTIEAPRRIKKVKGTKGKGAALAKTVEEIIKEQASSGWDYLRTDVFPVEEKSGLFSKRETVMKGVMVFQKLQQAMPSPASIPAPEPAPRHAPARPAPEPYAPPPQPTMVVAEAGSDAGRDTDGDEDFVARAVGSARGD